MADRDKLTTEPASPGALERFLFSAIPIWLFLLLMLIGCLLVIGFGAAVLDAEREKGKLGPISQAALAVAEIPYTAKEMLSLESKLIVNGSERFRSKPGGWSFPSGPMTGPPGYLLLSRYDGTAKRHKLELLSLPTMRIVHSWTLNASELLKDVTAVSRFAHPNAWDDEGFRQIHPWLEDNGDLIVKDFDAPLFRVNPCGKRLWVLQDAAYHHSTEADAMGNFWIPSIAEPPSISPVKDKFRDDTISQISPSGKVLYTKSVAQILMSHGYSNWLFTNSMYSNDPTHLNDIEPALADGPYWKKGDLFLSVRNVSAIMLYRPSTDQIVWMKRGPWMSQHDVDILDDHRIGVYDNAAQDRGDDEQFLPGSSQVMVYDFATGKVSLPLEKAMNDNNVRTMVEGLFTQLPDGSTLVEDGPDGRLIIFRSDGRVAAEYVERAKNGQMYRLGWSRYIDKPKGDIIMRNLRKVRCNA